MASDGTLTATGATITGTITSDNATLNAGMIAGWNFNASSLTSGKISLNNNGTISIGSTIFSAYEKNNVYYLAVSGDVFFNNGVYIHDLASDGASLGLTYTDNLWTYHVRPQDDSTGSDDGYFCGTYNYRWRAVYAKNGTIQTSDRNVKNSINRISDIYESLFMDLKPVSYKFNNGDRIHIGYISQDIEESMHKYQLSDLEFAGFCKDISSKYDKDTNEDIPLLDDNGNLIYNYSLRYSEFIALNTHMIQKAYKRIEELEKEIERLKR